MMKFALISSVFAALAATTLLTASPAIAQSEEEFEIYVDERGRRVVVDPYTGEVVRIIRRNEFRNFKRNRRAQRARERARQRQERRDRRRARLDRELGKLFGFDRNDDYYDSDDDFFSRRRPRSDRGFYLDELDEPRAKRRDRVRRTPPPVKRKKLAPTTRDTEVARLPDDNIVEQQPVKRAPKYKRPNVDRETVTKLQIFLDREGFSPGAIDGVWGGNVSKALEAWEESRGGAVDLSNPMVMDKYINKTSFKPFTQYTLTSKDVRGPFAARIPIDYAEKARLERMSFTSAEEMLAERFHMSLNYLKQLNPGVDFYRAGQSIRVVEPGVKATRKVHYIVADKGREQIRGYDRNGALVTAYPATIGSASTPSPSGKVEVARIALNPDYTYNPKKNFTQGENHDVLTIPPGPNGPVGSVWIALSKPTYGIHGTPNPELIGKTNSHGCIRLTNWDATELAGLVKKGVTVEFVE